jgi:hypothetical protein
MLRIRQAQHQVLSEHAQNQFIESMVDHLRHCFPAVAWALTAEELRQHLHDCIAHAAGYGITSQRQVCRFVNLAACYGWRFDRDPELFWMRKILTDTSLALPGERLDHLVQSCLQRERIAQENALLRQQLGLSPAPDDSQAEPAQDYLGPQRPTHALHRTTGPSVFALNPLGYHRSRSLWQSAESCAATDDATEPAPSGRAAVVR